MSEFNVYRDGHKMRDEIDRLRAELDQERRLADFWEETAAKHKAAIARVREVAGDYWDWKSGKTLQAAILRTLDGGTE